MTATLPLFAAEKIDGADANASRVSSTTSGTVALAVLPAGSHCGDLGIEYATGVSPGVAVNVNVCAPAGFGVVKSVEKGRCRRDRGTSPSPFAGDVSVYATVVVSSTGSRPARAACRCGVLYRKREGSAPIVPEAERAPAVAIVHVYFRAEPAVASHVQSTRAYRCRRPARPTAPAESVTVTVQEAPR